MTRFILLVLSVVSFYINLPLTALALSDTRQTTLSATIPPSFTITKIGEHDLTIKSKLDNPPLNTYITTYFSPLTILGTSQPYQQLNLSLISPFTSDIIQETTAYADGSFWFTIDALKANITYQLTITTVSDALPNTQATLHLTYIPITSAGTTYVQKPQVATVINYKLIFISLIGLLVLIGLTVILLVRKRLKRINLLAIEAGSGNFLPNYKIIITQEHQPHKIITTNKQGIARLPLLPAFELVSLNQTPNNQIASNISLPKGYLIYQTGTLYIKNHRIFYQNKGYKLNSIKGIVFLV